jgi:hypothetical protein
MRRRFVLLLAAAALAAACEPVTSQNIQKWKGTEKGPGKLEKALANPDISPALRAEAAVALGDIDLHLRVQGIWKAMPPAQQAAVAQHLVPLHAARIESAAPKEARGSRDALFELREGLAGESLQLADQALVRSVEKSLRDGRLGEGRHAVAKIAAALGPAAVAPAVEGVLQDGQAPFAATADLLNKLGDVPLKQRAGAALARRAEATPVQPAAFWEALAGLGGSQVTDFLMKVIRLEPEARALAAARAWKAMPPGPRMLPFALEAAGDPKVAPSVRGELFALAETLGGPAAIEGFLKLAADDKQPPAVRYRAFAAALAVGKAEAVGPALAALPDTVEYKPEEVASALVQPVVKVGEEARPPVLAALEAKTAIARLAAVQALEALGTREDAKGLARLSRDRAVPGGFPRELAVGKEATRVAKALKDKPGESKER